VIDYKSVNPDFVTHMIKTIQDPQIEKNIGAIIRILSRIEASDELMIKTVFLQENISTYLCKNRDVIASVNLASLTNMFHFFSKSDFLTGQNFSRIIQNILPEIDKEIH